MSATLNSVLERLTLPPTPHTLSVTIERHAPLNELAPKFARATGGSALNRTYMEGIFGVPIAPKICAMGKICAELERKIPLFPAQIRSPRSARPTDSTGRGELALSSIPIERSINPTDSNTFTGCNTSKTTYLNPDFGRGTCDFPQPTRHRTARAFQAAFADGVNVAAFSLTTCCTLRGRCPVRLSTSSDMRS